jgi:hypothetical protein
MASVEELSIEAFDADRLASRALTVVDFAGAGTPLGPAPLGLLEELAAEFEGRCRFCRFVLEGDPGISARIGIGKPCIVLYEHGIAVDRLRSAGPAPARDAIVAMVTRRLPLRPDDDCADGSCVIPP